MNSYMEMIQKQAKHQEGISKFNPLVTASYEPGKAESHLLSARSDAEMNMLLGELNFLRMNFDESKRYLKNAILMGDTEIRAFSLVLLASLLSVTEQFGEFDTVMEELKKLDRSAEGENNPVVKMAQLALYDALFMTDENREKFEELLSADVSNLEPNLRRYLLFLYSKLLMADGKYDALISVTQTMSLLFVSPKIPLIMADMHISCAILHYFKEETEQSVKMIEVACDLLMDDGFIFCLLQYAPYMDNTLTAAIKNKWPEGFEKLEDHFNIYKNSRIKARNRVSEKTWADNLTKREFEVATLASTGMTNKEIAAKLDISVNTVRTLLSRGCDKLQVTDRRQIKKYIYSFSLQENNVIASQSPK